MTGDESTIDEILSVLRGSSKRITSAKKTVAVVLVSATRHLTADEVTAQVQELRPDVSPSTIYRILEEFENLHIVVHSHLGQSAAVYHLAGVVHGHLSCESCGVTIEIPAVHFDALSRDLLRNFGFRLDRHHVALSGTCQACQEAQRSTP